MGTNHNCGLLCLHLYYTAQSSGAKWKSSFKPIGERDDDSQDKSTGSPERYASQ